MKRKIWQSGSIVVIFLLFPTSLFAADAEESAFEESQKTASRENLELYGGNVEDIAVASDGTVYVALNSANGIFYSTNGKTWIAPPAGSDFGTGNEVEVSEDSVFVIGGISLYRSQDEGKSWEQLSPENVGSVLHYGQGKLFVGMRDGTVQISEDEGETFTTVTIDSSIGELNSIATSATTSDVWLLGGTAENTSTLYKSTDSGETWASTEKTIDAGVVEVYVKPTDPNFLILRGSEMQYSTNGGTTWSTLLSDYTGRVVWSDTRLYVGLSYSDDNGATWSQMNSGDAEILGSKIAVDPTNSSRLYMDTHVGMATTEDAGATWVDMNEGLQGVVVNDIAQYTDKDIVWLATDSGLAKTENFQDENPLWEYPITPGGTDATTAVWINAEDADRVVVGVVGTIWYSTNGGEDWTDLDPEVFNGTMTDFVLGEGVLYASYVMDDGTTIDGGVLGIEFGENGGVTSEDTGLDDVPVNALAIDSHGNLYAAAGDENYVEETTRGIYRFDGSSWEKLDGANTYLVNDILIVDDIMYAAAGETESSGVFRSKDLGETWKKLDEDNGLPNDGWFHALAADSYDSENVYVSTARPAGTSYIYKSMDGGETWSLFYTGLKDERILALLFDGLTSGTDTGLYTYTSKVKLKVESSKSQVKKGKKVTLKTTIKDAATKEVLKNRKIKFFHKTKGGNWKYFARAKTNKKGEITLSVTVQKTTFFQARFTPKSKADRANYPSSVKSEKLRIVAL